MLEKIAMIARKALTSVNNVMCRGVLNSISTTTQNYTRIPLANVTNFDNETIDKLEFAQDWGFMSSPPVDGSTELIMAFLRGQRDQGFVLKSFNRLNPSTKPVLSEGECCLYNKVNGCNIILKQDGSVVVNSTVGVTFNTPLVTMIGSLSVDGDIIDNATGSHINNENMRALRATYNSHTHPGVAAGGANTGAPNQLET